ncbi:MAG: glycosyltransferase family 4 protein [Candidatus Dormibacteraeota bacterium]|nr:glycosyltransferase family 4 protein [Candidatus Dormibacteraeota bacterium]MBV9525538.1 glycosyltransferase family 4 protein [Candidatus Dormibacteraeota bacterium]
MAVVRSPGAAAAARRPRIAVIAPEDARRRSGPSWTDTANNMARSLHRHAGDTAHVPVFSPVQRGGRLANAVARGVLRHPCDFNSTWLQARDWARLFRHRLEGFDLVLATSQTALFALLETRIPIVYTADATFRLVREYYPFYAGLPRWNVHTAESIESRGLHRAALVTYPSEWAASSAREDYCVPARRVSVVPYGANIDAPPPRSELERRDFDGTCRLLFSSGEWARKGGDIAYATTLLLRRAGIRAELTVVGCAPPRSVSRDVVRVVPRLDKDVAADRQRLAELFLSSHLLFVPTRADCSPRVFCEASAYGVPSVTTDTGGVSSTVEEGRNGHLLPLSAGPDEYAALIASLMDDEPRYRSLVHSSREMFDTCLNWDAWGRAVAARIGQLGLADVQPLRLRGDGPDGADGARDDERRLARGPRDLRAGDRHR